jgi:hypothetical protein
MPVDNVDGAGVLTDAPVRSVSQTQNGAQKDSVQHGVTNDNHVLIRVTVDDALDGRHPALFDHAQTLTTGK